MSRGKIVKHGQRKGETKTVLQPLRSEPQVQKVQIPKSMMTMSFLKHPDLTVGQRRYLYSIAKIYSTSYMRSLINKQYLIGYNRQNEHASNRYFGVSTYQENQFKTPAQSGTSKKLPSRLPTSLSSSPMVRGPDGKGGKALLPKTEKNKPRSQSQNVPTVRSKSKNTPKACKERPPSQKDSTEQPESGTNENNVEQASINESMNVLSIKDEEEKGYSEKRESRIIQENEENDSTIGSVDSISIQDEKDLCSH
ncbi:protein FAM216A [Lissotriton helveticus]